MRSAGAAPLALGILAVLSGVAFLWDVGALSGMASRNVASFVLGLAVGWGAHRVAQRRYGAEVLFAGSCALLIAVLLVGVELGGVKRWLPLGPIHVQPGLILAPLLLALTASQEGRHWRALVLVPIALVAAQPDGATSVALAAGVATLMATASGRSPRGWSQRRIAIAAGGLILAVLGLIVAGFATPPPVAFVEGTVQIAMLSGGPAITLHMLTMALMLAALVSRHDPVGTSLAAYFGASALSAVFLAFPMPLAGAGPSHVIGFGIAVGWLAVAERPASRVEQA